jgi:hypothetical protein
MDVLGVASASSATTSDSRTFLFTSVRYRGGRMLRRDS